MIPLRRGKMLQARASDGSFRQWTGDDFGIGVCPQCSTITIQPPMPDSLKTGFVNPVEFRRWQSARVCKACGWTNQT